MTVRKQIRKRFLIIMLKYFIIAVAFFLSLNGAFALDLGSLVKGVADGIEQAKHKGDDSKPADTKKADDSGKKSDDSADGDKDDSKADDSDEQSSDDDDDKASGDDADAKEDDDSGKEDSDSDSDSSSDDDES